MPFTLTMPKLSPTMESGTIVKWLKKEGEQFEPGEVLMEVATDKATVEYQAIDSGWLRKILVPNGQEASVNQPIAIWTEEKSESMDGFQVPQEKKEKPKVESQAQEKVQETPKKEFQQPGFVPEQPLKDYEFEYPTQTTQKRVMASPLAKKLAKDKGLDLTTVKGTGPNQRIMSRDLEKAQSLNTFGSREMPKEIPGSYEEQTLSPMRKIIGQRLQESKSFIPHFYIRQEVFADGLVNIRDQLKNGEIQITFNDLMIRACALSLKEHPQVNCGFNSVSQAIIQFKTIDIAVAVGLEEGLITPIIRHADFKNLGEISVEMKSLARKAKEGKLEQHEYKGGSFTISNLGMFGVNDFAAIINPPQAAILAVGGIIETPVVKEGSIVAGKTMSLTLSVDHRVIDGVLAAKFLQTLKHYLENSALLLI